MRKVTILCLLLSCLGASLAAPGLEPAGAAYASESSTLDRPFDPVVLTGADVWSLSGIEPGDLVAFRYDGGWQQIPVQVDERAVKDFADVYNVGGGSGVERGQAAGQAYPVPTGVSELFYADMGTFTGPDPDATLDDDDEIAFMAKDAGGESPSFSEPPGVIPGSGVEVTIIDPLDVAKTGCVYLFQSDGSLDPGAGQQYVSYKFNLDSGEYLETYNTANGPNPENSLVTTPYYSHHFSDRWISDEIKIAAGGASGVDILDRHKNLFGPGICGRSEDTFSDGEGAFVANKSGPVRTIRSYVGANSGPLTQRDHIFYERRQDIRTFLRVHLISGIMDFFDYSPAASGMTYYNDLNTSGVAIDGNPDSVAAGAIQWEMVTGAPGSLVIAGSVSTNIEGFAYTSYYLDDTTPDVTQCTGDAFAYGSSGTWIDESIPCTDPGQDCTNYLHARRVIYYDGPGLTVGDAQTLASQANTPLTYKVGPFEDAAADTDGDTVPNGSDEDDDNDGCTDIMEVQRAAGSEMSGGLRDPHNPWDFFDPTGPGGGPPDRYIDLFNDIQGVIERYTAGGGVYDPAFDRGPATGPNLWNTTEPDGTIDLFNDILGVISQYQHDCREP